MFEQPTKSFHSVFISQAVEYDGGSALLRRKNCAVYNGTYERKMKEKEFVFSWCINKYKTRTFTSINRQFQRGRCSCPKGPAQRSSLSYLNYKVNKKGKYQYSQNNKYIDVCLQNYKLATISSSLDSIFILFCTTGRLT